MVTDAVRRLAPVQWSWSPDDVESLAAELGWPLIRRVDPQSADLSTGYAVGSGLAIVVMSADPRFPEQQILVPLSEHQPEWRFPLRTDVFAMAAGAAAQVLGPADQSEPGQLPRVAWTVPGGELSVEDDGTGVGLGLESAVFAAFRRETRERERSDR
jgi:hypothetical protein